MRATFKLLPLLGAVLLPLPCFAGASTVSPAVGKYLLQAESALKARNYPAALRAVDQAGATGHLSDYESVVTAQLRGQAAAGAGNYQLAATSYQVVLASSLTPASERLPLTQAVAGFYDHTGNYPQTIAWVNKYVAAGGQDAQTRALAAQAEYAQGHYAAAAQDIAHEQKALGRLPEAELQLEASAAQKAGDSQGYFQALQSLLQAYPNATYWNAAIALVQDQPGFPDQLTLDVYRLREATGTLNVAADYEDYAERAILAGQAAEAKRVLDAGFAKGVLTAQTDAGHAARLQALAAKQASVTQASTAPASVLDQAIAAGRGFDKVPGYAEGSLDTPQAALARLWVIVAL
jgi:tetratricopeptide (TPR) repeat protein